MRKLLSLFGRWIFFFLLRKNNPYPGLAKHLGLCYVQTNEHGTKIFVDKDGERRFTLTQFGFVPLIQYNLGIENKNLKNELEERNTQYLFLSEKINLLSEELRQEKEKNKSLEKEYSDVIHKSRVMVSTLEKQIDEINRLTKPKTESEVMLLSIYRGKLSSQEKERRISDLILRNKITLS